MALGLPLDTLAILWLGALVGGVAAGGSGFAFALAASSIWLHRIDPLHSAIMCTGCGVLLHLTTIWPQRRHIEIARLWPFLLGGIAGVPIGVPLLAYTDAGILKMTIGLFLIAFGSLCLHRAAPAHHYGRRPQCRCGSRFRRRHSRWDRRLFRCFANDLHAAQRLAEGNRARRLPALHNHHTGHHFSGYNSGDIRSQGPVADDCRPAAALAGNLDRLAALRQTE